MLKNKFGMLKVVALALTVLMLATLVACNKGMDDAAIQDAINAAVSSNAAEQEKVAQSLADAQAKAEAEAQAKAEAAEKAAAEAQAKAEAAEKAAAEAKKKAEEEAKAAAESAKKAQEAADAAKKEAEKLASSISQSQKDAATATTAPAADADAIAAINAEFAAKKYEYLTEKKDLYLAANLKELALTFDKAAVELQNAKTKAAAEGAFESLKVAIAAIESVETRANAVQALIADLGDVETTVFTAQAEKIKAALDAYEELEDDYTTEAQKKVYKKIVDKDNLDKAESKKNILVKYIEKSLSGYMTTLIKAFPKLDYDAEDDRADYRATLDSAIYAYRMLEVINDGNVAAADIAIDWDFKLDSNGDKIASTEPHPITGKALKYELDKKAPIAYFTAEELKEIFILPTLDADFEAFKVIALGEFETAIAAVKFTAPVVADQPVVFEDADDILEDAVDAFEATLAELTFVGSYKGNKIFADAKKDVYGKFAAAYVDAVMEVVETSKAYAIELYTEDVYEEKVEVLNDQYGEQPAILANYLAKAENELNKFTANVNSAAVYDYAGISAEAVRKANKVNDKVVETKNFFDANGVKDTFYKYVETVVTNSFKKFAVTVEGTQDGTLGLVTEKMIADLKAFRDEWTDDKGAMYDTLAQKKAGSSNATPWDPDAEPDKDTWDKDEEVAALKEDINDFIAALQAVKPAEKDIEVSIQWKDNEAAGKDLKKAKLYFKEEAAMNYFNDMGYTEADVANDPNMAKTYFTHKDTGFAWTYTYTAEEQAVKEAQGIYETAWKTIFDQVVEISGLNKTYGDKITKKDSNYDKAFNAAKDAVYNNEDLGIKVVLQDEIKAFGDAYKANIATILKAGEFKSAGVTLYSFFKQDNTVGANHVTLKYEMADDAYASAMFSLDTIKGKLQAEVDACQNNVDKVSALYTYRFNAVAKVSAAVNAAKYAYTIVDGVKTASGAPTYAYAPTASGAALYEKKISDFVAAAEKDIMGVKMTGAKTTEKKDWTDEKILDKNLSLLNYENAVKNIDAIVADYIGTTGTAVVIAGTTYDAADSLIFKEYKQNILNNWTGWASLEKAN